MSAPPAAPVFATGRRSSEAKYLGRLVLDGPMGARPQQEVLQRMITMIEKMAPSKNKRKVTFEMQMFRKNPQVDPMTSKRPCLEKFVAFNTEADGEFFNMPMSDIISIGGFKKCFVFVTLQRHGDKGPLSATDAPSSLMDDMERKMKATTGRFYVQAFRCKSSGHAQDISKNLIEAVELVKMREMQHLQRFKRKQQSAGWVSSVSLENAAEVRERVAERQGRNPLMSPLPDELPFEDIAASGFELLMEDEKIRAMVSRETLADTPVSRKDLRAALDDTPPAKVLADTPPDKKTLIAYREIDQLQETMNDHSLSPISAEERKAAKPPGRRTRRVSGNLHAKKLQNQFGEALNKVSTTSDPSRKLALPPTAQLQAKYASTGGAPHLLVKLGGGGGPKDSPESGYDSNSSVSGDSAPGSNVSLVVTDADADHGLGDPSPLGKATHVTVDPKKKTLNRPLEEQLLPTTTC